MTPKEIDALADRLADRLINKLQWWVAGGVTLYLVVRWLG
jgi:hypothetical protein